jgi:hypothetical protein
MTATTQSYQQDARIAHLRSRLRQIVRTAVASSWWRRFLPGEKTISLLKSVGWLGILAGLITWLGGSYFQWTAAWDEKRVTSLKEDYAAASAAFTEILMPFSSMANLRQILFFTYYESARGSSDETSDAFLF